jgi:eukaryotic-like serine/threonine-protein kinase
MTDAMDRLTTGLAERYRIERRVGAGGMATVYLAHDVRHQRQVALKVLRPDLSAILGADRFLNEIRVTANLQHPHILALYDSGEIEGLLYYVMPFIEGETLRQRLDREKQLPVEEAVDIARAVGGALDYAHRHGVIHRDIKPENILLHEGQPVVADFGIALAVSKAGGSRLTETGLSLGTPSYMSPEQATGDRAVDGRSDLYSLASVTYEMLAGDPPHTGSTAQAIIAKIVTEQPAAVTSARPATPVHVVAAVHKALSKLPADRFHSAAEFVDALGRPGSTAAMAIPAAPAAARPSGWRAAVTIGLPTLVLGAVLGWFARPKPAAGMLGRFTITMDPVAQLSSGYARQVALSADGTTLAMVGRGPRGNQVYVRAMADTTPRPVPGTEGALGVFISPDGRQIGFTTFLHLLRVPIEGGSPTQVGDSAGTFACWLDDGSIAYVDKTEHRILVARPDGTRRLVATSDSVSFVNLSPLPGSRTILVTVLGRGRARMNVAAVSLRDGSMKDIGLGDNVIAARYVPGGYVVFQRRMIGSVLLAAPFDLGRLQVRSDGQPVAPSARITFRVVPQWDATGSAIVVVPPAPNQLVLVDRGGRTSPLEEEPRAYHHPRFSPDGRLIALDITDQDRDLWIVDTRDRRMTRLTVGETANDAFWSPDGRRLAYTAVRGGSRGIFLRNADGSGGSDSIYTDAVNRSSGAWTPDGKALVSGTGGSGGLWVIPLDRPGAAAPIAGSRTTEAYPALSRDGRWLAYVSDESGRQEVYVRPFPGPGGRIQVSVNGGNEPVFTRDGRELIYREDAGAESRLVSASYRAGATFEVLSRTPMFNASNYASAEDHANFDVSPDGRTFVFVRAVQASQIRLVQNWAAQLEAPGR